MIVSSALPIQFWLITEPTFNQKEVGGILPVCYYQKFNSDDELVFQIYDALSSPHELKVFDELGSEIYSTSFSEVKTSTYEVSFTPSDHSITNQNIQFKIDSTHQSDFISIKNSHRDTIIVQYSNSNDYAGLVYSEMSPPTTFYLRIPAVFFHEEPITQQEDLELSDSTIQTLWSQIGKKRKLELGFLPYYMHEKIVLILGHQYVTIDGKDWIRRDDYEIEPGNKRYPLKQASVMLTDQDYIKKNLL